MSKILLVADFHFGIHGRTRDITMAAEAVRRYAQVNSIKHVFILGDLFHDRESTNVRVANTVYDFLSSTKKEYGQEWYVFPGNHDMFFKYNWSVTSLKPYSEVCNVMEDIHRVDVYDKRFWCIPFIAVDRAYMSVVDEIDRQCKQSDVLLTHIGCIGASYNLCFLFKEQKAINFDHRTAGQVYTGHFHCYHRAGVKTHYVGSPIPFSFDEGVVEHGFIEYDCHTSKHRFVDLRPLMKEYFPGQLVPPDMLTIPHEDLAKLEPADIMGNHFRVVTEQPLAEELVAAYRKDLLERGAKVVRFINIGNSLEPEIDRNTDIARKSPQDLFKDYFRGDKNADKYNEELMMDLNSKVVYEGESLYTVESIGVD